MKKHAMDDWLNDFDRTLKYGIAGRLQITAILVFSWSEES